MRSQRLRSLLPWIIAFKAFKSVTLTALAIVLLTTRHADPADVLMRFALAVHLPLTSLALRLGARLGEQPDDHTADRVADHGARLRGPLKRDVEPETVAIKRQRGGDILDDEERRDAGNVWLVM